MWNPDLRGGRRDCHPFPTKTRKCPSYLPGPPLHVKPPLEYTRFQSPNSLFSILWPVNRLCPDPLSFQDCLQEPLRPQALLWDSNKGFSASGQNSVDGSTILWPSYGRPLTARLFLAVPTAEGGAAGVGGRQTPH